MIKHVTKIRKQPPLKLKSGKVCESVCNACTPHWFVITPPHIALGGGWLAAAARHGCPTWLGAEAGSPGRPRKAQTGKYGIHLNF